MARLMVPSTPASRGEITPEEEQDATQGLTLEDLQRAAAALGYDLTKQEVEQPAEVDPDATPEEPGGNASGEEWANYARAIGASEDDLVDGDGQPLGRNALRDKYQSVI